MIEQPVRDETAVRTTVENMAALLADYGVPRMSARILITEMVAEEDALTAAELGERLGVSPAAISHAVKYLTHVGLLRRESVPNSRRDRYRVVDQSWFTAGFLKSDFLKRLACVADDGISSVGGPDTKAGARLAELRDFYEFISAEILAAVNKWHTSRSSPTGRT